MQKSVAIVLIIAAFLAGALADRVVRWATTPDAYAGTLPGQQAATRENAGTADEPTTWDMNGCMTSAGRRGMSQTEAQHACQEILK